MSHYKEAGGIFNKSIIMAVLKSEISRCGLCRFYSHEGRRGGSCSRLNAPVASRWEACKLAAFPFEESFEDKNFRKNENTRNRELLEPLSKRIVVCQEQFRQERFRQEQWSVPETASELVANAMRPVSPALQKGL